MTNKIDSAGSIFSRGHTSDSEAQLLYLNLKIPYLRYRQNYYDIRIWKCRWHHFS